MPARARNLTSAALTCVMAVLLCLVQTASAVATRSLEKTASGNFFAAPGFFTGEIASESLQSQWEIDPAATPSASGRQVWLSADPLGEEGGLNLYAYVLGNPINSWDPLSLICVGDKYSKEMLEKVESTILGRQLANAVRAAEKNTKRSILIRHDPSGRSRFTFNDITLGKNGEYQDPSGNWHPFTSDQILVHELQHALDSLNNELKQHSDNKKCSPGMQDGAEERAVKRENQYLAELLRALRKDYISTRP